MEPTDRVASAHRGEVLWTPPDDAWERSRLPAFARRLAAIGGPVCEDYPSLLSASLAQPDSFWSAVADHAGVRWHAAPSEVRSSAALPGATWFPGGRLNHAEFALRLAGSRPGEPALVGVSQTRDRVVVTWDELVDQVARCRAGLVERGVGRGDRVVGFLPTIPETTIAFLATASLGAIWSSCAPEFGVRAVTDRWSQIEPTLLLTIDGYGYGDKRIDRRSEVEEIIAALPSLRHVVRLPYLEPDQRSPESDTWSDLLASAPSGPVEFEPVPFDHPLYVLFSSGTTGLPKPIIHGHGGISLEHWKALALHYDLRAGDRFCWFTTTGWMMWNFLASSATVGATAVLFDGDPGAPDLSTLWRLASDERVDVMGVSAPFVMACRKAGLHPGETLDLSSIRHVGSTGAPLPPEGFDWLAAELGPDVQIGSMSGGTDVCTAFVGAAPTVPVRRGEISTLMLGCDVRAVRPDGTQCAAGETGELVIASPMPSMPVSFWDDEPVDGEPIGPAYRAAYFDDFPGVWTHGDWITFTDDGACVITGRSDATLNRGGVRLGTSDFYTVVEDLDEIADSLVVHLEDPEGGPGELILLVAPAPGSTIGDDVIGRVRTRLRTELSPRHVPDVIEVIRVVPRTLSGKKLEVPVKRMLLGAAPDAAASRDSLADPGALDEIAAWIATR